MADSAERFKDGGPQTIIKEDANDLTPDCKFRMVVLWMAMGFLVGKGEALANASDIPGGQVGSVGMQTVNALGI
jgi:hypothetical protein